MLRACAAAERYFDCRIDGCVGCVKYYFPVPYLVFNALDGARVDPFERRIIWPDGESLNIDQSVGRIRKDSGFENQAILSHLIGWLQMEYTPEGFDEEQMERFENQIENWVEEYENDLPPGSDF